MAAPTLLRNPVITRCGAGVSVTAGPRASAQLGAGVPGLGPDLFGESACGPGGESETRCEAALHPVIEFFVPGEPKGKGRLRTRIVQPRAGKAFVHGYTPGKTVEYENMVRLAAEQAMGDREVLHGPVRVTLEAHFPVPSSVSKPERFRMLAGSKYPRRYDIDNIVKAIFDGMNLIVWNDDKQVVQVVASKAYSERTGVLVKVWPVEFSGGVMVE